VHLSSRGTKCIGSSPIQKGEGNSRKTYGFHRFYKPCPYGITLDLDTTNFRFWKSKEGKVLGLKLSLRCQFCLAEFELRRALRQSGALREECEDRDICQWPNCFVSSEHLAKYCSKHIRDASTRAIWGHRTINLENTSQALKKGLAPPVGDDSWTCAGIQAFENFVEEYRNGQSPSAIVLDPEFGNDVIFMGAACGIFTGDKIFET
jgi:hypothetical protein